jgi:hypothetical protein
VRPKPRPGYRQRVTRCVNIYLLTIKNQALQRFTRRFGEEFVSLPAKVCHDVNIRTDLLHQVESHYRRMARLKQSVLDPNAANRLVEAFSPTTLRKASRKPLQCSIGDGLIKRLTSADYLAGREAWSTSAS